MPTWHEFVVMTVDHNLPEGLLLIRLHSRQQTHWEYSVAGIATLAIYNGPSVCLPTCTTLACWAELHPVLQRHRAAPLQTSD